MHADLDDLATALYLSIDDYLLTHPGIAPERPKVGIAPKLTDAELITLAVMQSLLGFTSEARWLRHADAHLAVMFPSLPTTTAAYNKRLRKAAATMQHLITVFATSCPSPAPHHHPVRAAGAAPPPASGPGCCNGIFTGAPSVSSAVRE